MMNWVKTVFRKYATFQGRAQRAEYWYFVLFYVIVYMVLGFLDGSLSRPANEPSWGLLSGVFALATLVPSIAVSVRRLHNTNRSGWWMLVMFVPLIGQLVMLIFMVLDGTPGDNRFGSNPKQQTAALPGPPGAV